MSIRVKIFSKISLALILVLVVSVIWPNAAQASVTDTQKSFSVHHNNSSTTFIQEVDEDERAGQETQLFEITTYSQPSKVEASNSTVLVQQVESLFFRYLFSNITTQAP